MDRIKAKTRKPGALERERLNYVLEHTRTREAWNWLMDYLVGGNQATTMRQAIDAAMKARGGKADLPSWKRT